MSNSNISNNITQLNHSQDVIDNIMENHCRGRDVKSDANTSGEILLMMLLISLSISLSFLIKRMRLKIISDHFVSAVIGIVAGLCLKSINNTVYVENLLEGYSRLFLIVLLPPIIFESVYNMNIRSFFNSIGTITIFGVLGSLLNIFSVTFLMFIYAYYITNMKLQFNEALCFGALISATDSIVILSKINKPSSDFYSIIFGESIFNNALSLVIYRSALTIDPSHSLLMSLFSILSESFIIFILSAFLGFKIAYFTALFLRILSPNVRKIERIEIGFVVVLPWISYLLAQMYGLSGIIAMMFNGISHAVYTKPNLSGSSYIVNPLNLDCEYHIQLTCLYV